MSELWSLLLMGLVLGDTQWTSQFGGGSTGTVTILMLELNVCGKS